MTDSNTKCSNCIEEIRVRNFVIAVMFLSGLVPAAASAGPRDESRSYIARCDQIADDRGWLDCVYGAVQPMRARLGLVPAPEFQQRLVPGGGAMRAAPPRPVAMAPAAPAAPVRKGDDNWVHLTAYNFNRHGMFTVTLPDGTVWQQQADDVNYAHWKEPASHYVVSVGEGLAGHGVLELKNDGNEYQVTRVR
jgi:hypothetical protein